MSLRATSKRSEHSRGFVPLQRSQSWGRIHRGFGSCHVGFPGQWGFLDNGISRTMGFLPVHSPPFSPWALSQCHIYHKTAKAAFSPRGQSHPRPVQDLRTDHSTSPNSPQGAVIPGKAAGSAPGASAGSQARPELSLSEVSATAASHRRFLGLIPAQTGTRHRNGVRNSGRDSGRVLGARKYPLPQLGAASPAQTPHLRAWMESLDNRECSVGNPQPDPKGICWIWGLSAAKKGKSGS